MSTPFNPAVVAAAISEGVAKRKEMLDTMAHVKGPGYAFAIDAAVRVINFANMIRKMAAAGAIHPSAAAVARSTAEDVCAAAVRLLVIADTSPATYAKANTGITPEDQAMVADINALLALVDDAERKISAS